MNKLFIGLLIVAAGAGIFFLLRKKQQPGVTNTVNRELLTGQWQTVLYQPEKDSAQPMYRYDFRKDSTLIRLISDTLKPDTLYYTWDKTDHLLWKKTLADTTGQLYTVRHLSTDSLQLLPDDSSRILLTRL